MSEELFTNRHGHTITAVEEAVKQLPEPEHVLRAAQPRPVRQRRKFHVARWQKWAIFVVLILIVVVPLAVGEYVRAAYTGEIAAAKSDISGIFSWVVSQQKGTVSAATLSNADTKLAAVRDKLCAGGFFDNLAQLYPRSKQAYEDCGIFRSKVVALDDAVKEAQGELIYLTQLTTALGSVTKPLEDQFAVLTSQQENWQNTVTALGQLSVPISFQTAHNALLTSAQAVRDQWIALVQATNAYDSGAFSDVKTKLSAAYSEFQNQAGAFTSAITAQQAVVTAAVAALK